MTSNETDRLGLPYLAPQQAQKHVIHNEAIRRLDAVVQASVKDRDLAAAPAAPSPGDAYIAAAGATGDWSGGDGALFVFQDGAWTRIDPHAGFIVFVEDDGAALVFDGSAWVGLGGPGGGLTIADLAAGATDRLGVNATADATNRLAIKSDAVLFNHDDETPGTGDCRVVINKDGASGAATLLFQSASNGRAEIGLAGDDSFHFKVSPDGFASSTEALTINKDDGSVVFGGAVGVGRGVVGGRELAIGGDEHAGVIMTSTTTTGSCRIEFGDAGDADAGSITYDHAADELYFRVAATNNVATFGSGFRVGFPTGGDRGVGAINAEAIYDYNVVLSCYVFDQALDGAISLPKWDAKVPDRIIPAARRPDRRHDDGDLVQPRTHNPARRFKALVGTAEDPLTLDGYAKHWRKRRHLASMPDEARFDPAEGMPAGDWIQRLIETVEIQAILIEQLNERTRGLLQASGRPR